MNRSVQMIAVACAAIGFEAGARSLDLVMWRGETAAAMVPENIEYGEAKPEGISIRTGCALPVRYADKPGSMQRHEVCDRVVWGADEAWPRILEVTVPADAKPGVYKYGMVSVKVLDRVLPPAKEWKYYLDLWQHPWAVARYHGVQPFSKEHYAAMKPVYELLATAGQKTITVSLMEEPWGHQCYDAYHSMFEDGEFRLFDEYVQFCMDCGLGPDISCYSLCPWTLDGRISEEFEKKWGAFLTKFSTHLKEKGWFRNVFMAMDERKPEQVKEVYDFVQKYAPGMRISMAGNRKPSDFKGITIDSYSQRMLYSDLSPEFLAEVPDRRAKGYITTIYVCCGPIYPNTFMNSGNGEAFWLGAAPAAIGLDGFLRWAWNSWPKDPVVDASFWKWTSGDTFLCYPGGVPSWRFLELRNGIIAAEKIRILKEQKAVTDAELAELGKIFDVKQANENRSDFPAIRKKVLELVNRDAK